MTAQQQLAVAINALGVNAPIIALLVIRDHGPAIAELIEECSRKPKYNGEANRYNVTGFGIDIQFPSLYDADFFIRDRIAAALRKLTQDA